MAATGTGNGTGRAALRDSSKLKTAGLDAVREGQGTSASDIKSLTSATDKQQGRGMVCGRRTVRETVPKDMPSEWGQRITNAPGIRNGKGGGLDAEPGNCEQETMGKATGLGRRGEAGMAGHARERGGQVPSAERHGPPARTLNSIRKEMGRHQTGLPDG